MTSGGVALLESEELLGPISINGVLMNWVVVTSRTYSSPKGLL